MVSSAILLAPKVTVPIVVATGLPLIAPPAVIEAATTEVKFVQRFILGNTF